MRRKCQLALYALLLHSLCGCTLISGRPAGPGGALDRSAPNLIWTTALPENCPRAEVVDALLTSDAAAALFNIHCASGAPLDPATNQPIYHYRITELNDKPVSSFEKVYELLPPHEQDSKDEVSVKLQDISSEAVLDLNLPRENLMHLLQHTSPSHPSIRLANGSTLFLRSGQTNSFLSARVERSQGLLVLDLSLCNTGPTPTLLPIEISATVDSHNLPCLTASETLDIVYEQASSKLPAIENMSRKYSDVSESQNYTVVSNFETLIKKSPAEGAPLLAALPGQAFPGPPVLADARALSGYLLQPKLVHRDDPPLSGWVIFAADYLKTAQSVQISIETSEGVMSASLALP